MNAPTPSALRVLVVDDDPDLCCLLSDYLSANGFVVRTVGDGAAMREALARELPDAIVMDLMLPGEDGLSLTRSIKAQWDMPVLMLSARGEEMDRVIGLEVGADD
ncbi:MAG: response regulator, partial [Hydrogenophaga sp.]|nr:response regulator [Hydrogenophaga sp.]